MVTALLAAMLFAFFAYTVLASDQGAIRGLDASLSQARLRAAAEAGVATVMERLGAATGERWPIDGRPRQLDIGDNELTVTVEDERGKVNLNAITHDQARRLFAAAGVRGAQLDQLSDSLMSWLTQGAGRTAPETLSYAEAGLRPRGGPLRTLGELAVLHGMTPQLLAEITPSITLFFGDEGVFDPATATPLARAAMSPSSGGGVSDIVAAREQAGQRTALDAGPTVSYVGRLFTVRVVARDGHGGVYSGATLVELTGMPSRPVWIRAVE